MEGEFDLGKEVTETDRLLNLAFVARRERRLDDARRDLVLAVSLCRQSGERMELAQAVSALGRIERDLRLHEAAIQNYQEAAGIYRTEGDALNLAHTIRHLADIHREQGRVQLAESNYQEALSLYREEERTQPLDLANTARGFALLKAEQARALWQEANALYASVDVEAGVAESAKWIARLENARTQAN